MAKTNKSAAKRLKVTKNGKVLRRSAGHNHFNAKARRTKQLGRKGWEEYNTIGKEIAKKYLPNR